MWELQCKSEGEQYYFIMCCIITILISALTHSRQELWEANIFDMTSAKERLTSSSLWNTSAVFYQRTHKNGDMKLLQDQQRITSLLWHKPHLEKNHCNSNLNTTHSVLPKPVCGGKGSGGCFILGGRAGGRGWPWSFNLMSFIAIENSWISMRPSLFISARALQEQREYN